MTVTPFGVMAQTPPFTDSVQDSMSDTYIMQLTCSGAQQPITWTTTAATSPGFLVSPGGVVGTSTLLPDGVYTASGTMIDAAGNNGQWSFGLTVFTQPAPQTAVTPVTPLPYSGIEIQVPFNINPATGMVSTITDFAAIMEQHVLTILMTSPGERVMLPTYGAGLERTVFTPITDLTVAQIQDRIEEALASSERSITLVGVDVSQDPNYPMMMNITVTFTAVPYAGVQSVTVTAGGGLPAIPTSTIGPFL